MAYRYGDRNQLMLFPPCVDDFVPKDAAVRAYDAMVEALDFKELATLSVEAVILPTNYAAPDDNSLQIT